MKKTLLYFTLLIITGVISNSYSQTWTTIATDGTGDGNSAALMDGTKLEYWYNSSADSIWFRITTASINSTHSANVGINIMVNYTGGGSTFNFWGNNNSNPFHKLLTGWVTGSAPSAYSGTIGIANAAGVNASPSNYTNLFSNNLDFEVNTSSSTIVVKVKRSDLVPNSALGTSIKTAAAVGSSTAWNDDIYSATGTMTLTRNTASIDENKKTPKMSVFPNPANNRVTIVSPLTKYNQGFTVIYSVIGTEVARFPLNNKTIDVSFLNNGTYFIKLINEEGKNLDSSILIKQ